MSFFQQTSMKLKDTDELKYIWMMPDNQISKNCGKYEGDSYTPCYRSTWKSTEEACNGNGGIETIQTKTRKMKITEESAGFFLFFRRLVVT